MTWTRAIHLAETNRIPPIGRLLIRRRAAGMNIV